MKPMSQRLPAACLRLIERLAIAVASPLLKADTLQQYADAGCWLYGALCTLAVFLLYLWHPLSLKVAADSTLFTLLSSRFSLNWFRTSHDVSLPAAVSLLLLVVAPLPSSRFRLVVGKCTIALAVNSTRIVVCAGDWLIRHRWTSLVSAALLLLLLPFVFQQKSSYEQRSLNTAHDYDKWITRMSELVLQSPLDGSEQGVFKSASELRRPQFMVLGERPDLRTARQQLWSVLALIYERDQQSDFRAWIETRADDLPDPRALLNSMRGVDLSISDREVSVLLAALMGRIEIRRAGAEPESTDHVVLAMEYFDIGLRFTRDQRGNLLVPLPYLSALRNGVGMAYGRAVFLLCRGRGPVRFRARPLASNDPIERWAALSHAWDAFSDADSGFGTETIEYERKLNNQLYLLSVVAKLQHEFPVAPSQYARLRWMVDPSTLAQEIEERAVSLLGLSFARPAVPMAFSTAAEAFAVSADLRRRAGEDANPDLRACGFYLRVARALNPSGIGMADLGCFRDVIGEGGTLRDTFAQELVRPVTGFATVDTVRFKDEALKACQSMK